MRHVSEKLLWHIWIRHLDETFGWAILMKQFDETFWWNILIRHFDEKFWWDILLRQSEKKFWWEIFLRNFYETFWWPLKKFCGLLCPLMNFDMVMMLLGWPYDSFDCHLYIVNYTVEPFRRIRRKLYKSMVPCTTLCHTFSNTGL